MSDTPETDAIVSGVITEEFFISGGVMELCRRLERERYEARRLAEAGRDLWSGAQLKTSFPLGKLPWED
jgi:hypothetical protein